MQAIFSGDEHSITTTAELVALFVSFSRLARLYGLDGCIVDEQTFEASPVTS